MLQTGDIVLTTSRTALADAIRAGQMWHEHIERFRPGMGILEAIEHLHDLRIPTHSRMIYSDGWAAEMTWPESQILPVDAKGLTKGDTLVGAYRCPWLDDKRNPESAEYLRNQLARWMYEHGGEHYGFENFIEFLSIDYKKESRRVCSMWTTQALITCVICEGYPIELPEDWMIAGIGNTARVGLVSPNDQKTYFTRAGWGIAL